MKRRRLTSVLALAGLLLAAAALAATSAPAAGPQPRVRGDEPDMVVALAPIYEGPPGPARSVIVTRIDEHVLVLRGKSWLALGFFDGARFEGPLRGTNARGVVRFDVPVGTLRFTRLADGTLEAAASSPREAAGDFAVRWKPANVIDVPPPAGPGAPSAEADPDVPAFGEYVYVEELPEATTKLPPEYPDAARRGGIQGEVVVQALVARDGTVADTRIVKSVPGLDEAAVAAVRRWRFKPAQAKGRPVAVWVAVPVRFTLH